MNFRADFPFFQANPGILYADSAATSHKPSIVTDAMHTFSVKQNATVHRTAYRGGIEATQKFEDARALISQWIGSDASNQIVFTKGATEALNLAAFGLLAPDLLEGNEILLCATEHHANLLPWQRLANSRNMTLRVMPIDSNGRLELNAALDMISDQTAVLAMAHVSNALGNRYPIETFIEKASAHGCISVIDGTQAVAHMPVNVSKLGCDLYVFSGHKMFGPNGVGVLYGRYSLLEKMQAYQVGGEMVKLADYQTATFMPPPTKFEAGTPNVAGVIGLGTAVQYIQHHQADMAEHERALAKALFQGLRSIQGIKMYGDFALGLSEIPIVSLNIVGIHHHDLALMLDAQNIAVRSGHHCAMPLMSQLKLDGTLRISLSVYNRFEDVEVIVSALRSCVIKASQPIGQNDADGSDTLSHQEEASLPLSAAIQRAKGWDNVYRQLMLSGKQLTVLPEEQRTESTLVEGCEAAVWLNVVNVIDEKRCYSAYSPSKIVRGLLAIILEKANSLEADAQGSFDYIEYLHQIGLQRFLSESRQNGTRAVIERLKSY